MIKFYLLTFTLLSISLVQAEEIMRTTTTWEGKKIAYPEGQAEVTAIKLKIPAGKTSPFHCHPVPTMGYVLKGKIEVETRDGKKIIFSEGEPAVEVLKTVHRGKALEGDVEIVVFYAGAVDVPHTVLADHEDSASLCGQAH